MKTPVSVDLDSVSTAYRPERSDAHPPSFLDNAPICIHWVDAAGIVVWANRTELETFGYARDEYTGRHIAEFHADPEVIADILDRLRNGETLHNHEARMRCKDGSIRYVAIDSNVVREDGRFLHTCCFTRDVTEQRRVAARARAQFDELETIYRTAPIGLALLEDNLRFARVNERLAEINGIPIEQHAGRSLREIVPDLAEQAEEIAQQVIRTGEPVLDVEFEGETRAQPGSKRTWHESWYPIKDAMGQTIAVNVAVEEITERKQTEEALAHLAAIVASSSDAIVSKTLDGIVTSWNTGAERIFGYSAQEMIGQPILRLIPPERHEEENRILARLKAGQLVDHFETVRVTKAGRRLDVSLTISPVKNGAGNIIGASKIARDITERKRAEQALAQSAREKEALYQLADRLHRTDSLGAIHDAALHAITGALQCDRASILLFDEHGVMRFVGWRGLSERYRKAVEGHSPWKPDEVNPEPICIADVATAELDPALKAVVKAEGIGALAFIPLVSDGKLLGKFMVYFDAPHAFAQDEIEIGMTIGHQLAFGIRRRRAEEMLRHNARQLALITDTAPVYIAYCDAHARFKLVNKAYAARFGLKPADCVGRHVAEVVGEQGYNALRRYVDIVLSGTSVEFETGVDYPNIGERFMHCSYAPELDTNGKVVGFVAAITDITERRRIEEALRQSEERLREADRRKDAFLATLAHELRNPLAPLLNGLRLMQLKCDDTDTIERVRTLMERQLAHMVRLIDDLLDVSRISLDKIELRRERAELNNVLRQATETIRPLIDEKRQQLTIELAADPIPVDADVARLAQIVGNLLSNASKFTPAEGSLRLSAEREGQKAVIRVRDTGVGIAAEQFERIFDMFTQVDASLERAQTGLGIGLTLVKTLTEMHGGTVEARSPGLGQGSEFTVRLPIAVAKRESATDKTETSEFEVAPTRRVLVVDDNIDSADSLAALLEYAGHHTRVAKDGVEAIQAAAAFEPEVILLDIGLPKLNGYEVARWVRAQPWGESTVLVALTGWSQENYRRQSKDAGFDSHLVKPVDYAALMQLLADIGRNDD